MPIYKAKNYNGKTLSIVLAKSLELAEVYWQGKDIVAHSVEIREGRDIKDHITGVMPLINMREVRIPEYGPDARDWLIED